MIKGWQKASVAVLLAGCVHLSQPPLELPPALTKLEGARLLLFSPTHRWQALLDWQGSARQGWARITHSASGEVVEIRWRDDAIDWRTAEQPLWRPIAAERLAEWGIVLPPKDIAGFFAGTLPADAQPARKGWRLVRRNRVLFVRWLGARRAWRFEDRRHGRWAEVRLP